MRFENMFTHPSILVGQAPRGKPTGKSLRLYYAAVVNGLLAPPLLVVILLIANNKKIMGDYVNRPWSNWLGWSITGIMSVSVLTLIMIN